MGKEHMVQIHNGILFSHKKERNPPICDNVEMDHEGIMLCEISQKKKDK